MTLDETFAGKRVRIFGVDAGLSAQLAEIFRSKGGTIISSGNADLVVASPAGAAHVDPGTPLLVIGALDDMP